MPIIINHAFTSLVADDAAASAAGQVLPSHWNATHGLTMSGPALAGRITAGSGAAIEIPLGANLAFVAGALAVSGVGGVGTVTNVSVSAGNGFTGTVADPTGAAIIQVGTSISAAVVKANGTALQAAAAGTDYVAPGLLTGSGLTVSTAILLGRTTAGTGAVENIAAATNAIPFLISATSASLAAMLSDETGTGANVFAQSAVLVTPALGTIQSGNLAAGTAYTVTALAGAGTGVLTFLTTASSANLAAAVTDETGSGSLVFATSATLVTPVLGTIQSGNLAAGTGYTIANVAGMATNAGAFLVSATSASLLAALTDETGSGVAVFNTTASLIAPTADRYTVSAGNTYTVTATTYTAAAADNGRVGRFSATCVVSVNTGLPAGWWGAFRATTSSPLTITGSATVNSPNGRKTRAQWSELVVKYDASDVYVVSGDSTT